MPTGEMIFALRTASGALPVNEGTVTLYDGEGRIVFSDKLDRTRLGVTKKATVETPPRSVSLDRDDPATPYGVYRAEIRAEGFYGVDLSGLKAFDGVLSKVKLPMTPLPAGTVPPGTDPIVINVPEHALMTKEGPVDKGTARDPAQPPPDGTRPAVQISSGVYVPETITVHLGPPDSKAENVTVPFTDYLKNVAASEIYPTWPEAALRSNVLAQTSIALNRVYTEWYRSRGYDFDITSSTAYDQAYLPGGNTYEETDMIVDELFNNYLTRPDFVEPLFASFCDGRNTTCDGLSQWGTVELAEDGRTLEEILGFYFGEVNITETDDIRDITESYPGTPLKRGDEGEDVRNMQLQLNRIAINYPRLPLNNNLGVFDEQTEDVVKEFQKLFALPVTGEIDKSTWYKISYLYTSVKQLAELTSEGQRPSYNTQEYPGHPLKKSDKGSEVQEMQFYLRRISRFNPLVRPVNIDGIFDLDTEESVRSFQNAYRTEVTGIIDEPTWNLIVAVYNGTFENVDEPILGNGLTPYPGRELTFGSRGDQVEYIQRLLQSIRTAFPIIPDLAADGFFGSGTEKAVNTFAALFAFPQDGVIGEPLWNEINRIYTAVALGCIFSNTESEGSREFPGITVGKDSPDNDIIYVQNAINTIYTSIPYVGQVEADGDYGESTAKSVGAFQRVFGLTVTETVNRDTWILLNYIVHAVKSGCLPKNLIAAPVMAKKKSRPSGSQSKAKPTVAEIKAFLRENGMEPGSGPFFGGKTRRALAFWQAMNGLEPTGRPDKKTLELIKKRENRLK